MTFRALLYVSHIDAISRSTLFCCMQNVRSSHTPLIRPYMAYQALFVQRVLHALALSPLPCIACILLRLALGRHTRRTLLIKPGIGPFIVVTQRRDELEALHQTVESGRVPPIVALPIVVVMFGEMSDRFVADLLLCQLLPYAAR